MSGRPACSQCVCELAASVTVPGVVEMVTVVVPVSYTSLQLKMLAPANLAQSTCTLASYRVFTEQTYESK